MVDDVTAVDDAGGAEPEARSTVRRATSALLDRLSRHRAVVAGAVAIAVLGAVWTAASPVGSGPDDTFHLASIWCSATAPDDACNDLGGSFAAGKTFVDIPAEVSEQAHCYVYQPEESAECVDELESGTFVRSIADDGLYPGLYHDALGVMVGDDPVRSALLARMASWIACMALLTAGWSALPRHLRSAYVVVLMVTAIPHAISLWASTNPSGVVIAADAAAWCGAIGVLHATGRDRLIGAAVVLALGTVAAVGSRADGGLYLFVALVAACLLAWRPDREAIRRSLLVLGVAGVGFLASFLILNRRLVASGDGLVSSGVDFDESVNYDWNNLLDIPYYISGNFGVVGTGWMDVPMPHGVWVLTGAVFFGLVFWGLGRTFAGKALALVCVLGGLLAIPYLLLWRGGWPVAFEIQPRYTLPLLPILGFTALYWRRRDSVAGLTTVQLSAALTLITVAHSLALHRTIRRYVTGTDVTTFDLDADREWWWEIPIGPNAVWLLGSVAFGVLAIVVGRWIRSASTIADAADEEPDEQARERTVDDEPDEESRELTVDEPAVAR